MPCVVESWFFRQAHLYRYVGLLKLYSHKTQVCSLRPAASRVVTVVCFNLLWSISLSRMNVHLAKDSCGYLCTNSLHRLIAAWLNASHISQDGVRLNRSATEQL